MTPQVSDAFRQQCESANREDQHKDFERAGILVPRNEVQLGDVIGRGEFGGSFIQKNSCFYLRRSSCYLSRQNSGCENAKRRTLKRIAK